MTDLSKIKPSHTQRAAGRLRSPVDARPSRAQPRIHRPPVRAGRQSLSTGAGLRSRWSPSMKTSGSPDPVPTNVPGSLASPAKLPCSRRYRPRTGKVSRLARNNGGLVSLAGTVRHHRYSHWRQRRRLPSCAVQRSPAARLKGTMSEAELHIIRARLDGGIRNKAARGNCAAVCRVGFIGENRMGKSCFIRTRLSPAHPHGLRALRRVRFGAPRVAVVPFRRTVPSAATGARWPALARSAG